MYTTLVIRYSIIIGMLFCITMNSYAGEKRPYGVSQLPISDSDLAKIIIIKRKTFGDWTLNVRILNPPNHRPSDMTPCIVFVTKATWRTWFRQMKYLASRGMVAITADIRMNHVGHSPNNLKLAVQDGKSAIRWIRSHASELGIDPNRLAVSGGSHRGHIAACLGTTTKLNEEGDDMSISGRPNAMVLFNPVLSNGPERPHALYEYCRGYWEDISPQHNIDKNTPPTILYFGTEDFIYDHAEPFKNRMDEVGIRCDLHTPKGKQHGYWNFGDDFLKVLFEVDEFLISLGYLKGEPNREYEVFSPPRDYYKKRDTKESKKKSKQ